MSTTKLALGFGDTIGSDGDRGKVSSRALLVGATAVQQELLAATQECGGAAVRPSSLSFSRKARSEDF